MKKIIDIHIFKTLQCENNTIAGLSLLHFLDSFVNCAHWHEFNLWINFMGSTEFYHLFLGASGTPWDPNNFQTFRLISSEFWRREESVCWASGRRSLVLIPLKHKDIELNLTVSPGKPGITSVPGSRKSPIKG